MREKNESNKSCAFIVKSESESVVGEKSESVVVQKSEGVVVLKIKK
jgi:hypothetical protein